MTLYLGVDAGGTKTHAVLADAAGRVIAEAVAGPGNPLSAGEKTARRSLKEALRTVLVAGEPAAAHLGFAGAGRRGDRRKITHLVRSLGLGCTFSVSDDAEIAFRAVADPPGVVLVCGTGSIAVAYAPDGTAHRSGGHGYLLGDEGSGYWIGREAVRAALRAADGRGEPTRLEELPAMLGLSSLEEVVSGVYGGRIGRRKLAEISGWVLGVEDPVARRIAREAARELALCVRAASRGAGLRWGSRTPLVLAGGLLREGGVLREMVISMLPGFCAVSGDPVPALGAARLAGAPIPILRPG
ncbi:N-acetylmuramic acid/N-acetylglucosamine kinase [Rubrobacter xylanophilus DSM 9941]|uniref:N-acetylglucosamine kinase n=1 Tax=Rubrobacter xylanophilus TaxID=49319 RepID=UPI001C642286|nr:BadF/BadG/BcrA/BcrD ATPase family protein [Rubrobacter xylanophilus]QYJ16824.1 N-acetylmuramic acid/N-acetylglucosamine kinase [Rubrobacter xylanophilus DSM 9941]